MFTYRGYQRWIIVIKKQWRHNNCNCSYLEVRTLSTQLWSSRRPEVPPATETYRHKASISICSGLISRSVVSTCLILSHKINILQIFWLANMFLCVVPFPTNGLIKWGVLIWFGQRFISLFIDIFHCEH